VPIYRVSFGFAGLNTGWTETHMMNNQSVNALGALPAAQVVAGARALMLGRQFSLNGIRVSIYSDGGSPPQRVTRNVTLDKTNYGNGGTVAAWDAEPAVVAYQAIGTAPNINIPVQFQGNKNTTFLGGPTDDTVTAGGKVLPAVNNLLNNFNIWKQTMIVSQFGWGAVQPYKGSKINTVTQNADATVTFVVTPPVDAGLAVGVTYPIRVKGINQGRSPLNRALSATYTAVNTFVTKQQIAFATMQGGGFLTPYQPVNLFVPYANIILALTTAKHKRGKPFLSAPGRARKEIRA
jgi:hypothetical protein